MISKNLRVFTLFLVFNLSIAQEFSNENLEYINSLPEELRDEFLQERLNSANEIETEDNITFDNSQKNESIDDVQQPFFGYSFFESSNTTSTPILDIPLQGNYKLNFNDQLELLLTGNKQEIINLRIDMSGNVLVPEVGPVSLVNLDLEQANNKIQILINQSYVGTQSYLSVSKASLKKISIIGAVKNPGTFLVNPFISLTEAIKYAGGLVENSSLRKIKIIDSKDNMQEIDLYDFLVFGKRKNDINLQNGDTIMIPATSNFVEITGEVLRPQNYEYSANDTVKDLIEFAMGTNSLANSNNISIFYLFNQEELSKKVYLGDLVENSMLELNIGKLVSIPLKSARIFGDSVQSGTYEIVKGEPLSKLIDRLKFSGDVYPFYFLLKQTDKSNQLKENYNLSLFDKSTYENIPLKDNVEIHFFTSSDFLDSNSEVSMDSNSEVFMDSNSEVFMDSNSEVITPMEEFISKEIPQIYFKSITIGNNAFNLPIAGRFSPEIISNFLGINEKIEPNNTVIKTIRGIESNSYKSFEEASNVISIAIPAVKIEKFNVEIRGQVNSPGIYEVDSSSTLAELYMIAGGLKPTAFKKGIFFSRDSIKEREKIALNSAKSILYDSMFSASNLTGQNQLSLDIDGLLKLSETIEVSGRISGNFDDDSQLENILYLEENDYVFVPNNPTTITVYGEVLNPISTNFKYKLSFRDYIKLAGGYTVNADKKSVYVIKANGESFPLNSGAFQKEVYIEPGDTIIIPRDTDRIGALPLISIATKIISDLTFAAAALNALSN